MSDKDFRVVCCRCGEALGTCQAVYCPYCPGNLFCDRCEALHALQGRHKIGQGERKERHERELKEDLAKNAAMKHFSDVVGTSEQIQSRLQELAKKAQQRRPPRYWWDENDKE